MFSKRLAGMVPEARKYVAASVALQWVALAANIALMLLMGAFVQSLVEGGDVAASRANLVMAAAAAIVVRVCCLTLSQRMGQAAAAAAKRTVRKLVYDKLVRLGPSYSERVSTSEAVQVSVEGTEQLESYFGSYLPQLFYSVLAPLTLFACLAPLCFPAAVALLACVPLIPASIVAVQKIAKRAMGSYWDAYTDLGATFLENLQGLTTLKIYRVDADRHEAMNREAETFRQATMRLLRMQLNSVTVMDVFAYGGAAVGIVMALWQFSLGQAPFFAAFAVIFLAAEFFIPLRTLGSFFHTAMNGMAAADKMFAILDAPEPKRGSRVIEADRISFACRGVGYSYDGERTVLSDVDFDAAAGSFTGIVGESGSGKSTLAGILSGRNAGFAGSVEVGGVPIQEASRASLASTVTVVPFSSYLFKGSVRSNLLLADPQASDEELWEALRRCRAEGFVEQAGGLDAAIAEEGGNLSGGQRQRLALARALLRDTPAYVFDEATSNVDAESERAIVEVVHELARTKTVVVISHRLAAVAGADRIYVLEDGRVAEAGTHGELLEHGGPYARLWSRQAELERFSAAVEADDPEDRLTEAPSAVSGGSARAAAEPARCPDCPAHGRRGEEPASVEPTRRSHLSVMLRLVGLVRPLAPWMALAVVLGVLGFGAAIFLTVFGVYALVDLAGFPQTVGYGAALALVAVCGVARGPLRYGEQLCNHYLAFKLLALVRDRVFAALRRLAPAKLEGRDKGDLVSLVTGDIELLEVFYAHTLSPAIIAFVVSAGMTAFVATISPALGLLALASYLLVGVAVPYASSKASGMGGRELREGLGGMNAFVLDSLRGLRETLQFGRAAERSRELDERMDELARAEARLKGRGALAMSLTNGLVLALDVAMVLASGALCLSGAIAPDGALVATAALMSSFGPVIAVANLGSTLQQTLASGGRVLELLDERPQTEEVDDGRLGASRRLLLWRVSRARRREPAHRTGQRGAPVRAQRFGQVDAVQAAHALLGCHARRGGGIGHGCAPCEHGQLARNAGLHDAGNASVRRHHRREHPPCEAERLARRAGRSMPQGGVERFDRTSAARAGHAGGRAGGDALGRRAAAHRPCTRVPARRAVRAVGRAHVEPRQPERGRRAPRALRGPRRQDRRAGEPSRLDRRDSRRGIHGGSRTVRLRVERRSGYSHPPSRSVFPSKSFRMNAPCSYTA